MAEADTSNEEREGQRRRVLKAGVIAYSGRHVTLPCAIRDMSQAGARLIVEGSVSAPDTFELLIEIDGLEAACEVVWRRGPEIGVRFAEPPRAMERKRQQVLTGWTTANARPTLRRKPIATRD